MVPLQETIMGNTQSSRLTRIDWLAKGPLAPHVDAYKQYLTDRSYAETTFANCIRCVAHFAQWVRRVVLPSQLAVALATARQTRS